MKIHHHICELVGQTPLIECHRIEEKYHLSSKIFAKVEYFNPGGSIKDRIALAMIEAGEKSGRISNSTTIIEPTSGNTGIGLAMVCAAKGYKVILTMPETMSMERRALLKAYGATLVLTDGSKGMKGAMEEAKRIAATMEDVFIPSQFSNPANPNVHYHTTGPEIYEALDGNVDIFVAGVGTGGTISGVGRFLKEKKPGIKIVAVEPIDSPLLSQNIVGPHKIQGIGAGFIPDTLDQSIYDEVMTVTTSDAIHAAQMIAKTEGILVGISSGAALHVALEIAKTQPQKQIVVVLPDTGERYLSTILFHELPSEQ